MSREDWAHAALKALARGGLAAVAVEPLARKLGVTKGSFYWHFESRDALIEAALLLWESNNAAAIQEYEARFPNAADRLRALFSAAFEPSALGGLVQHLAAEREHPVIGPILRRVTGARLDHLTRMYRDIGLDEVEARRRALLSYAAYIGLFQMMATTPEEVPSAGALPGLVTHMVHALVP
jgi:AcrR family transcriptional regulator